MKLRRVLLTTDLSEESERPYEAIAGLARSTGASVTLLHVVEDLAVAPHGAPLAPPVHAPDIERTVQEARKVIEEHAQRFEGVDVSTDVITGAQVANAIAAYAEEHDIDLLAVSSHGRSGFRRMVMGSVAETLLRHTHRPVLVFPRHE